MQGHVAWNTAADEFEKFCDIELGSVMQFTLSSVKCIHVSFILMRPDEIKMEKACVRKYVGIFSLVQK